MIVHGNYFCRKHYILRVVAEMFTNTCPEIYFHFNVSWIEVQVCTASVVRANPVRAAVLRHIHPEGAALQRGAGVAAGGEVHRPE